MKSKQEALDLLERALSAATAAGCDAAHATLSSGASALTRFANNTIHQNVSNEGGGVGVCAVRGKRAGVAHSGVLTAEGVAAAAKKAAEIAAVAAEDPEFPGVVKSPPAAPRGVFDEETGAATPAARAEAVCRIIRRIEGGGAVASGSLSTSAGCFALANTAGTRQYDRGTGVNLNVVAMADTAAGCALFSGQRVGEMDAAERAELALRKCLDSRKPAEVEPGEYAVVLEPPAALELFDFLSYLGFSALAMQQGRSCFQGKLGQKVLDESITMTDDPHDPAGTPSAFDGEGLPKRRIELIAKGVLDGLVYDRRTAAKDGVESTGHGSSPQNAHGPHPGNIIVSPGASSLAEMIASTERGLLVSHFHYTNIAERSTATITGMTRYGLFEIADGKVARPLRNLRFTQSAIAALADVAAVSQDRERFGSTVVPALKVRKFRFTGKSDH